MVRLVSYRSRSVVQPIVSHQHGLSWYVLYREWCGWTLKIVSILVNLIVADELSDAAYET